MLGMAARTFAEVGVTAEAALEPLFTCAVLHIPELAPGTLRELALAVDVADLGGVPIADAFVLAAAPAFLAATTTSPGTSIDLEGPDVSAMDWVHLATAVHSRLHLGAGMEEFDARFRALICVPAITWLSALTGESDRVSNVRLLSDAFCNAGPKDTASTGTVKDARSNTAFAAFHRHVLDIGLPHLGSPHTRDALRILGICPTLASSRRGR